VQHLVGAVGVLWPGGLRCATATTAIAVRDLSEAEIDAYLATGEWRGRRGGYAIDGAGAAFVDSVDGDYENARGLPVDALMRIYPLLLERGAAQRSTIMAPS
jgi:septum formation protein